MTTTQIPEGFEPSFRKSPFTDPWEPIYSKRTDKSVIMGLWIDKPHTNARGFAHGGLIPALADNAMGYSCGQVMGWTSSFVTVSLTVDYLGAAQVGQWLTVEGEVLRTGRTLCFAQCLVMADSKAVARASGTFRVVPKPEGWADAGGANAALGRKG